MGAPGCVVRQGLLVFAQAGRPETGPGLRVAGLSLLERGVRTMYRAGIRHLVVVTADGVSVTPDRFAAMADLRLRFVRWGQAAALDAWDEGYLLVRGEYVHHHSSLTSLLIHGLDGHDLVGLGSSREPGGEMSERAIDALEMAGACLCRSSVVPPQELIRHARRLDGFLADQLVDRDAVVVRMAEDLWCRVADQRSARRARDMLFGQVTKSTSGTVARLLNVRLSVPVSKILVQTGITPNAISVLLVLLPGLGTAYLITQPASYVRVAVAGILWQLASVLDGCDGEVARVKLAETRFGAWLDTLCDNVAYLCAFGGLMIGVHRMHPLNSGPILAGISTMLALVIMFGVLYAHALKIGTGSLQHYAADLSRRVPEHDKDWAHRFLQWFGFVPKRDFLSLVLSLSLVAYQVEAAYWFLVLLFHIAAVVVTTTYLGLLGTEARGEVARPMGQPRLVPAAMDGERRL